MSLSVTINRILLLEPLNVSFRWVELQIDSLCDAEYIHCEDDVLEAVDQLPDSLETTYKDILEKFKKYQVTSRAVIERVLAFLLCAERTVRIDEMLVAITRCH